MTVLSPDEDAFGQALLAHLEARVDGRVLMLEVDDGRSMPAMHPREFFLERNAWAWWERDLLGDLTGPVLDLGCGAGRHILDLQNHGLAVTGVDVSPGAVETCVRREHHGALVRGPVRRPEGFVSTRRFPGNSISRTRSTREGNP